MKKNRPPTQASSFFNQRMQNLLASANLQEQLIEDMEQMEQDFEKKFAHDPQAGILKLLHQFLQKAFVSTVASSVNPLTDAEYLSSGAARGHKITIETTPLAGVSLNFKAYPILAEKFYSKDDVLLNAPETKASLEYWMFPDHSGFVATHVNDESVARTRGLFSFANTLADIKEGEQGYKLAELSEGYKHITAEIGEKLREDGLELEQKNIDQMIDSLTIKTIQAIITANQRSLPFDSIEESLSKMVQSYRTGNVWSAGVSVQVDGQPCPTPKDMFTLMGATPKGELSAIERYLSLTAASLQAESSTDFQLASGAINRWRNPMK